MEVTVDISEEDLEDLLNDTLPLEDEQTNFIGFEDANVQKEKHSLDADNNGFTTFRPLADVSKVTVDNGTEEESAIPMEKDASSVPGSEVECKSQTNTSIDEQIKGEENVTSSVQESSSVSGWITDLPDYHSNNEQETATSCVQETPSISSLEEESRSQINMPINEQNQDEETAISMEKETLSVLALKVDNSAQTNTSTNEQKKGEETAIPMEKEISSVSELDVDNSSQTYTSINEQNKEAAVSPIEKETSSVSGSEMERRSQTNKSLDNQTKGSPPVSRIHRALALLMEKETSSVSGSEENNSSLANMSRSKEKNVTGKTSIQMEKKNITVSGSKVDCRSQTNMSIVDQGKEETEITMDKAKSLDSRIKKDRKSPFNHFGSNSLHTYIQNISVPLCKENKEETAITGEEDKQTFLRLKVGTRSQMNMSMEKQNTTPEEEEDDVVILMEKEKSTVSGPEVEIISQTSMALDIQNKGMEIALENEDHLLSGSEMDMSMDDENKENDEENEWQSIQVCHFYNRNSNGCNTTAEECNWLHICACCNDDHPVKGCKMQKEKENLKKKLFRRGRRGGRTACEKRDSGICYYYNRNLNGCKDELCKLSHECFCCGEAHPIIACDHIEVKKTYKDKCYSFNRGQLGCREKKCEKNHCCFACAKGHPITSCNKKENMDVAAPDGKPEIEKPVQAFDIPYNYAATAVSHENDGPLCYAFNEGPNGCTEPEGTCKSVHACYTCGENHPVSSCKQSNHNKSISKITKNKGKEKPEKHLENLAKKIEEKQEMAKKISEKKELAILKIEEKIKMKKANAAPKHSIITLNSATHKENKEKTKTVTKHKLDKELTKSVTKHKPISPPPKLSSTDINISRKICQFFNSTGCRNSTNCPWFHGCSYCKGNHPVGKCRTKHHSKVDFCTYFNTYFNNGFNGCRNTKNCPFIHACYYCGDDHPGVWCKTKNESPKSQLSHKNVSEEKQLAKRVPSKEDCCYHFNNNHNGCNKSKDVCPFIHACSSCGGKHPETDCDKASNKSSVHHRNYDEISVTIKSYKGSNVKRLSTSSSHEQYERRYTPEGNEDAFMEHSGLMPLMSVADSEYKHYGQYRSRSEHLEEGAYTIQPSRAKSREREVSVEREHLTLHRSDSRESDLSRERDLRRRYYSGEYELSPERQQMRHHNSDYRLRHRSRSQERVKELHNRMLTRESRSRSRERYRPRTRERSMSSAERMMIYQVLKSKTGRVVASPSRERRSRSRDKYSRVSSSTDHDNASRLPKHFARESGEHHTKNEGHSSSNYPLSHGSTSSKLSSMDAVEICIILSNFCSDLGLFGPTLEEVCRRALSDKDNIVAFFKEPEVEETMELVSQKLLKLKSKSSNELHKEKYSMGIAKIEKLLEA